jgi:hypothetical protein
MGSTAQVNQAYILVRVDPHCYQNLRAGMGRPEPFSDIVLLQNIYL